MLCHRKINVIYQAAIESKKRKVADFNLRRFAKKYIKCVNYIEQNLPCESVHKLTFKSLIHHPEEILAGIFTFLDVDSSSETVKNIVNTPSRGIRQKYDGLNKGICRHWEDNLNEQQTQNLDALYAKKRVHRTR